MIELVTGIGLLLGCWVASTMTIADALGSMLALSVWGLMLYRIASAFWGG